MYVPAASVEYVHVPVTTATTWALAAAPTARMALVPTGTAPGDVHWRPAFTDADATSMQLRSVRVRYNGDHAAGDILDVWVEITAADEVVRVLAGRVILT